MSAPLATTASMSVSPEGGAGQVGGGSKVGVIAGIVVALLVCVIVTAFLIGWRCKRCRGDDVSGGSGTSVTTIPLAGEFADFQGVGQGEP
jgi:hypothetical protein